MLAALVISLIGFAVAGMVYLVESARIREREQQEQDWQRFLETGDDAGYKRRMKK